MKRKKILISLLLLICLSSFIYSTGTKESSKDSVESKEGLQDSNGDNPSWLVSNTDEAITVIDNGGNQVTIKKPVNKIISLGMGELYSCLRAIDADDKIVSSTWYTYTNPSFYPNFSKLPLVSDSQQGIDTEEIVELDPDVIFIKNNFYGNLNDTIKNEYPVVEIPFDTLDDIDMFATILGKEKEAKEYIAWINKYLNEIDEKISNLPQDDFKKVFMFYGGEYGMSAPPPYGTFGKDNERTNMISRAGGKSISANLPGDWITVDPEWLIEQDPNSIVREYYITDDTPIMGYSVNDKPKAKEVLERIIGQAAIADTQAVKTNNVSMIYGDIFEDSWFIGISYLAKYFHPDLFEDLNPIQIQQEYITRFQGLKYDLNKQGVFFEKLN
ncbi:MAG: ABC transporter substrate-binding protein [Sphaerochaeta sp.]